MLRLITVCIGHLVDVCETSNAECHAAIYVPRMVGCRGMHMPVDYASPAVIMGLGSVYRGLEPMNEFRPTLWHLEVAGYMVRTGFDF